MFGANSILDMGRLALYASQAQLQVTGENIANVDTEGYSRRSVVLQESISIDTQPGQMGTGVMATEVIRYFDEFIEQQYLSQSSVASKWENLYSNLYSVESLVNESSGNGLSSAITDFFQSWADLSEGADETTTRQALVDNATTLATTLATLDSNLQDLQASIEDLIQQDVDNANTLIEKITELNKQINITEVEGSNNPNSLYDQRDTMVRELAEIIDINVIDNGKGNLTITTQSGQTLVDGVEHFSLAYEGAKTTKNLQSDSTFDGQVYYDGADSSEYTIDVVRGGVVSNASTADVAMFRVSLDGGKTWLQDEDGEDKLFYARPEGSAVAAGDLNIWFGSDDNSSIAPTTSLSEGDSFTICSQTGLYWVENTSHHENITPQAYSDGTVNTRRCTGGSLASYFYFRDDYVGSYRDQLDTLAETLAWETNRIHSQGVGLENLTSAQGTYSVSDTGKALGSDSSGLIYGDRLQAGSATLHFYNPDTGLEVESVTLDFDGVAGGDQTNFDPDTDSLQDVVDAINTSAGTYVTASIVNNQLHLEANDGYEFAFGSDTTGLWAALGVNTFFTGSTASDLAVNSAVSGDLNNLCAGHVNGGDEGNEGDNTIALAMVDLADTKIDFTTKYGATSQTISGFYNNLVSTVGTDTANAKFSYTYTQSLADDLNDRQQEVSGVSLDEEMANLIRYQHAYTAAAKLITTADEMLQTVLGLKS